MVWWGCVSRPGLLVIEAGGHERRCSRPWCLVFRPQSVVGGSRRVLTAALKRGGTRGVRQVASSFSNLKFRPPRWFVVRSSPLHPTPPPPCPELWNGSCQSLARFVALASEHVRRAHALAPRCGAPSGGARSTTLTPERVRRARGLGPRCGAWSGRTWPTCLAPVRRARALALGVRANGSWSTTLTPEHIRRARALAPGRGWAERGSQLSHLRASEERVP